MTAILSVATLFSCSKYQMPIDGTCDSVTFRNVTQTKATESSFEDGDAISVFASDAYSGELEADNYSDNCEFVYSSGRFKPASDNDAIKYPDAYTSLSYYAVWPYSLSYSGDGFVFSVQPDQSYPAEYALSNLMIARTEATQNKTVDLIFDHMLCKIVINIHADSYPTGLWSCEFNNVYTDAAISLNDAGVETTGSRSAVVGAMNGTNSFKVILPPQKISARSRFLIFEIGDEVYQWRPEEDLEFIAGTEYVFDLSI